MLKRKGKGSIRLLYIVLIYMGSIYWFILVLDFYLLGAG